MIVSDLPSLYEQLRRRQGDRVSLTYRTRGYVDARGVHHAVWGGTSMHASNCLLTAHANGRIVDLHHTHVLFQPDGLPRPVAIYVSDVTHVGSVIITRG